MKLPFSNLSTTNRSPIAFSALRRTNLPSKFDCGPNFVTESPFPQFSKRLHLITLCSSSNCPNTTTQFPIAGRSSMEISDLTLELNDLKQDISEGVPKSAQAVEESEAGNQIGAISCHQSISMVHERAMVLGISSQPVVFGARKKTCESYKCPYEYHLSRRSNPVSSGDEMIAMNLTFRSSEEFSVQGQCIYTYAR